MTSGVSIRSVTCVSSRETLVSSTITALTSELSHLVTFFSTNFGYLQKGSDGDIDSFKYIILQNPCAIGHQPKKHNPCASNDGNSQNEPKCQTSVGLHRGKLTIIPKPDLRLNHLFGVTTSAGTGRYNLPVLLPSQSPSKICGIQIKIWKGHVFLSWNKLDQLRGSKRIKGMLEVRSCSETGKWHHSIPPMAAVIM